MPLSMTVSPSPLTIFEPSIVSCPYLSTMRSVTTASLEGSVISGVVVSVVSGTDSSVSVAGVVEGKVSGPRLVEHEHNKTAPEKSESVISRPDIRRLGDFKLMLKVFYFCFGVV